MSGFASEPRHLLELHIDPPHEPGIDVQEPIFAALERLPADGVLTLVAADPPDAALARLEQRGYRISAERSTRDAWSIAVQPPGSPRIADFRDLPAPEPLEQVLEASAGLAPGDVLLARVPRYPRMLLPRLHERGLDVEVRVERDETALVRVRRPA